VVSRDLKRAAIYWPYHLLGAETATSVLAAANLKQPTGGLNSQPRVDLGAKVGQSLPTGHKLAMQPDHVIPGLAPELMPAAPIAPANAIPYYLAAENKLKRAATPGEWLTYEMVDYNAASPLWQLRRLQDATFL
jgi:predicted homoserine dehydrogenase-like protein